MDTLDHKRQTASNLAAACEAAASGDIETDTTLRHRNSPSDTLDRPIVANSKQRRLPKQLSSNISSQEIPPPPSASGTTPQDSGSGVEANMQVAGDGDGVNRLDAVAEKGPSLAQQLQRRQRGTNQHPTVPVIPEPANTAKDSSAFVECVTDLNELQHPASLDDLPEAIEKSITSKDEIKFHSWAYWRDLDHDVWRLRYLCLGREHIYVYRMAESPPQVGALISTRSASGKRLKVKVGRKFGAPSCFHLTSHGVKWWFCVNSLETANEWASMVKSVGPSTLPGGIKLSEARPSDLKKETIDAAMPVTKHIQDLPASTQDVNSSNDIPPPPFSIPPPPPPEDAPEQKEKEEEAIVHPQLPFITQVKSFIVEQLPGTSIAPSEAQRPKMPPPPSSYQSPDQDISASTAAESIPPPPPSSQMPVAETPPTAVDQVPPPPPSQTGGVAEIVKEQTHIEAPPPLPTLVERANALQSILELPDAFEPEIGAEFCVWFASVLVRDDRDKDWSDGFAVMLSDVRQMHIFESPDADPTRPLRLFSLLGTSAIAVAPDSVLLENNIDTELSGQVLMLKQRRRTAFLVTESEENAIGALEALRYLDEELLTPRLGVATHSLRSQSNDVSSYVQSSAEYARSGATQTSQNSAPRLDEVDAEPLPVVLLSGDGDEVLTGDPNKTLARIPELRSLPKPFERRFGRRDCWHFGYLCVAETTQRAWIARFFLFVGGKNARLLLYESHQSEPDDILQVMQLKTENGFEKCSSLDDDEDVVRRAIGYDIELNPTTTFGLDERHHTHLFVARSSAAKHKWTTLIERNNLLARA